MRTEVLALIRQKAMATKVKQLEAALKDFCKTVEEQGGVEVDLSDNKDLYLPFGDEDWTDLCASYIKACKALGRKPKIEER